MANTKDTPTVEVRRSEDGRFVHYGVVENGVFHPFASERASDYDERIAAAETESS